MTMTKICSAIKTGIAGALALLESGQKAQAEEMFKLSYVAAKRFGSILDVHFALKALLRFFHKENRLAEARLIESLAPIQIARMRRISQRINLGWNSRLAKASGA